MAGVQQGNQGLAAQALGTHVVGHVRLSGYLTTTDMRAVNHKAAGQVLPWGWADRADPYGRQDWNLRAVVPAGGALLEVVESRVGTAINKAYGPMAIASSHHLLMVPAAVTTPVRALPVSIREAKTGVASGLALVPRTAELVDGTGFDQRWARGMVSQLFAVATDADMHRFVAPWFTLATRHSGVGLYTKLFLYKFMAEYANAAGVAMNPVPAAAPGAWPAINPMVEGLAGRTQLDANAGNIRAGQAHWVWGQGLDLAAAQTIGLAFAPFPALWLQDAAGGLKPTQAMLALPGYGQVFFQSDTIVPGLAAPVAIAAPALYPTDVQIDAAIRWLAWSRAESEDVALGLVAAVELMGQFLVQEDSAVQVPVGAVAPALDRYVSCTLGLRGSKMPVPGSGHAVLRAMEVVERQQQGPDGTTLPAAVQLHLALPADERRFIYCRHAQMRAYGTSVALHMLGVTCQVLDDSLAPRPPAAAALPAAVDVVVNQITNHVDPHGAQAVHTLASRVVAAVFGVHDGPYAHEHRRTDRVWVGANTTWAAGRVPVGRVPYPVASIMWAAYVPRLPLTAHFARVGVEPADQVPLVYNAAGVADHLAPHGDGLGSKVGKVADDELAAVALAATTGVDNLWVGHYSVAQRGVSPLVAGPAQAMVRHGGPGMAGLAFAPWLDGQFVPVDYYQRIGRTPAASTVNAAAARVRAVQEVAAGRAPFDVSLVRVYEPGPALRLDAVTGLAVDADIFGAVPPEPAPPPGGEN